jgi:hypothetical protein
MVDILNIKESGIPMQQFARFDYIASLSPKLQNSVSSPFREAATLENFFQIKETMFEQSYCSKFTVLRYLVKPHCVTYKALERAGSKASVVQVQESAFE